MSKASSSAPILYATIDETGATITRLSPRNAIDGEYYVPGFLGDDPVVKIADRAFKGASGLTSVVLPEGIRHIGASAFANCPKLQFVELPSTLESVGEGAFAGCPLLTQVVVTRRNVAGLFRAVDDSSVLIVEGADDGEFESVPAGRELESDAPPMKEDADSDAGTTNDVVDPDTGALNAAPDTDAGELNDGLDSEAAAEGAGANWSSLFFVVAFFVLGIVGCLGYGVFRDSGASDETVDSPVSPEPTPVKETPVPDVVIETAASDDWAQDSSRAAGVSQTLIINGVPCAFRWIPLGAFVMGTTYEELQQLEKNPDVPGHDPDPESNVATAIVENVPDFNNKIYYRERTRFTYLTDSPYKVGITRGFWLLETECPQELWEAVMGSNPSCFTARDNPVELVCYEDCMTFVKRLNKGLQSAESLTEKFRFNLPTEAEWEYACRAGTKTLYWCGDTLGPDQGNWGNREGGDSQPRSVAAEAANPWGLRGMCGNVKEWCRDWADEYPMDPVLNPSGPRRGQRRIIRGGAFNDCAGDCRSGKRRSAAPARKCQDLGFRFLLIPPQSSIPPESSAAEGSGDSTEVSGDSAPENRPSRSRRGPSRS